jgi:hypothetical protein
MTYVRVRHAADRLDGSGAAASHLAELVRGDFLLANEGPLIRPFGPPSPQGEKGPRGARRGPIATAAHNPNPRQATHLMFRLS